ncbi:MAG: 6-carboxytetrahydropterin synthase [Lachnospiraceae bacterium]|nr:6-carboxytetrahydropterin synthase [Lachnospiraceae bacterium]
MFILETEASFDAAHFLYDYDGKCRNIHGHRWRIIARIKSSSLGESGQTRDMVIDFGDFKAALKEIADQLDHSMIYETGSLKPATIAAFKDEDFKMNEFPFRPTAERFSQYFFEELVKRHFPVFEVQVFETPKNCATYRED